MVFCFQNFLTCCEKKELPSWYLEERLKFEAEGREFAKFLRSLEQEQFIRTVKGQNNFGNRMLFYIVRIE